MADRLNVIGKKFGRLIIIDDAESHIQPSGKPCRMVNCLCDCGNRKTILLYSITSGRVTSCGCYNKEINGKRMREMSITHGNTPTGYHEYKSLFFVWNTIKQRCYNTRSTSYKKYGAKGIKICDQWINDFANFRDWSISNGYYKQPKDTLFKDKLSIDRRDPDGDYSPDNCRWITVSENSKRRRININN